jgi:spermidine synthase
LGSASLTKWCYRYLPESQVQAVELNPSVVIAARSMFALPSDDERLTVIEADAWDYVHDGAHAGQVGVLQVDIYDATARGPVLDSVAFYRACRATLTTPGMLSVNLFGDHPSFERNMRHLKTAFEGRVVALPEVHEGNRIALAFSGPPIDFAWSDLATRAAFIEKTYDLPASGWLAALRKVIHEAMPEGMPEGMHEVMPDSPRCKL